MKQIRVLGMGDNVCDKYLHSGLMYPGGQALNFAVFASQLGCSASYLGVFGTDEVASHITDTLIKVGVEFDRCRRITGENGYAMVNLVEGDRVFAGSNKGGVAKNHTLELTQDDWEYVRSFELVHTSNNSYTDYLVRQFAQKKIVLSYDFSGSWSSREKLEDLCPWLDFAFLSCSCLDEESAKELLKSCHQLGCRYPTATLGEKGSMLFDGTKFHFQPPDYVEPLDTLGAGDAYATAFLVELLKSGGVQDDIAPGRIEKAMKQGADFSRMCCLRHGAFGYEKRFANAN